MKVALIDDGEVNLAQLRGLCRRLPQVATHAFTDPLQALAWCRTEEPDLVIVDYQMPGMDGIAFISALRAIPDRAETPLLMVTASHEAPIRYQALLAGANDYLVRPIDHMEFLARARNMLAVRRGQRALRERAEALAREVEVATEAVRAHERDTILRLSRAAEYRDRETGLHVMRIARYARLMAQRLGLSETFQETLVHAAPLHDIGKVGIPDHILLKPGALTAPEMAVVRTHALIGHEILQGSPSPNLELAAVIARSHHERFDGRGYPDGVAGEAIPLAGRIVAVADVFDALTSVRPYKAAWPVEKALAYIRDGAGTQFDPACAQAFLDDEAAILAIRRELCDLDAMGTQPHGTPELHPMALQPAG